MATISTPRQAFLHGRWTTEDSARLYGLPDWGKGYFAVNEHGHLVVRPRKQAGGEVDLYELMQGLTERGICSPVLIRFDDLLAHRVRELRRAFDAAIASHEYTGKYQCVYPIKVNQQRHICEQIRDLGAEVDFGLEAGSKPELLAVLALTAGHGDMPIVCNGFKDDEFIETVLLASKLGRNIIPVVEKFSELKLIIKHAKKYNVKPKIGVRVKLSARGAGKWEGSAGVRSKFGLFVSEALSALELLKAEGMADCLMMVHCHVGSQVSDIRYVKNAINELAYLYTELRRLGAGLTTIDIGGGLGVDYDGSQSAYESSINYTFEEYAEDVVYRIKTVCEAAGAPHPNIISESGRAMVAYSSVLIFDVLGKSRFQADPDLPWVRRQMEAEADDTPQPVLDLVDAYERLTEKNITDVYHDAMQARDEAMSLFNLGYMTLPMRAASERLFWAIGHKITELAAKKGELPEELEKLPEILSEIYFCNFSLFQSVPDSWAIDQLFPICPIHRLNEEPTCRGVLADISCDSDGKIDHFVDKRIEKKTLELHELREGEPYYLGVFLVGAYQETLGDLHNLFGDTHAVHVVLDDDGDTNGVGWEIEEVVEGDSVKEVLSYVQFDHEEMRRIMRKSTERAVKRGQLTVQESKALLKFYEDGLDGYTYLEE